MHNKLVKLFTIYHGIADRRNEGVIETSKLLSFRNEDIRIKNELIGLLNSKNTSTTNNYFWSKGNNNLNDFQKWWEQTTKGRSGLLVYLVPFFITQFTIIKRVTPFIFGITSQYIEPINLFTYYSLKNKYALQYARKFVLFYFGLTLLAMMSDAYFGGPSFIPMTPKSDSYALITGASSGLGEELARLYYSHGYNLILVARQESRLYHLKQALYADTPNPPTPIPPVMSSSSATDERERERERSISSSNTSGRMKERMVPDTTRNRGSNSINSATYPNIGVKSREKWSYQNPFSSNDISRISSNHNHDDGSSSSNNVRSISAAYYEDNYYDYDYENSNNNNNNKRNNLSSRPTPQKAPYQGRGQSSSSSLTTTASTPSSHLSQSTSPYQQNNSNNNNRRHILILPYDLRAPQNIFKIYKEIQKRQLKVDVLINNAGECHRSSFHELSWIKLRSLLDVNIQSTIMLTRMLLPSMIQRYKEEGRPSRVVIVSSIAGLAPTADVALYAASKSFLTSFAKSLRKECLGKGVAITCAMPGAIRDTRFALHAQVEDAVVFQAFGMASSAKKVALDIYRSSVSGRNQVIPGYLNKFYSHGLAKLLPESALSRVAGFCWHPVPKWLASFMYKLQFPSPGTVGISSSSLYEENDNNSNSGGSRGGRGRGIPIIVSGDTTTTPMSSSTTSSTPSPSTNRPPHTTVFSNIWNLFDSSSSSTTSDTTSDTISEDTADSSSMVYEDDDDDNNGNNGLYDDSKELQETKLRPKHVFKSQWLLSKRSINKNDGDNTMDSINMNPDPDGMKSWYATPLSSCSDDIFNDSTTTMTTIPTTNNVNILKRALVSLLSAGNKYGITNPTTTEKKEFDDYNSIHDQLNDIKEIDDTTTTQIQNDLKQYNMNQVQLIDSSSKSKAVTTMKMINSDNNNRGGVGGIKSIQESMYIFNITTARRDILQWFSKRWDEPLIDYTRVKVWFETWKSRIITFSESIIKGSEMKRKRIMRSKDIYGNDITEYNENDMNETGGQDDDRDIGENDSDSGRDSSSSNDVDGYHTTSRTPPWVLDENEDPMDEDDEHNIYEENYIKKYYQQKQQQQRQRQKRRQQQSFNDIMSRRRNGSTSFDTMRSKAAGGGTSAGQTNGNENNREYIEEEEGDDEREDYDNERSSRNSGNRITVEDDNEAYEQYIHRSKKQHLYSEREEVEVQEEGGDKREGRPRTENDSKAQNREKKTGGGVVGKEIHVPRDKSTPSSSSSSSSSSTATTQDKDANKKEENQTPHVTPPASSSSSSSSPSSTNNGQNNKNGDSSSGSQSDNHKKDKQSQPQQQKDTHKNDTNNKKNKNTSPSGIQPAPSEHPLPGVFDTIDPADTPPPSSSGGSTGNNNRPPPADSYVPPASPYMNDDDGVIEEDGYDESYTYPDYDSDNNNHHCHPPHSSGSGGSSSSGGAMLSPGNGYGYPEDEVDAGDQYYGGEGGGFEDDTMY